MHKIVLGCLIVLSIADLILFRTTGIRLRFALFSHALEIAAFRQSIPLKDWSILFLGSILGSFVIQWVDQASLVNYEEVLLLGSGGIAPFLLSKRNKMQTNLLFLWELEIAEYLSKKFFEVFRQRIHYPILRRYRLTANQDRCFSVTLAAKERPHVVFLFLESFRAKNIGCLGCPLGLSPFFDQWSKAGILFSQFQSNGIFTSAAMISSLFGIPPACCPSYLRYYLSIPLRGIPQILQEQSYDNAMILGGPSTFQSWHKFFERQGFSEIIGKREILQEYPEAEAMSWGVHDEWIYKKALSWLATRKKPAFLTLLTATNHHPWLAPSSWNQKEGNLPFYRTFAYSDWALGQFLSSLEQARLLEKSVIFIFGDHGQELGERGEKSSFNRYLYQENIHVPFLLLAKGRLEKSFCCSVPCSQIDLLPTLLDLLQINTVQHGLGESLFLKTRVQPQVSINPFQESLSAMRKGPWKFILAQSSGERELYHLDSDPEEKRNLAAENPQIVRYLKEELASYLKVLNELYQCKRFTPPQKDFKESCAHLDLSEINNLSKKDIKLLQNKENKIFSLNFSHCLFVNDEFLRRYANCWTRLARIDLSHCALVTDRGLDALLQACSILEEIDLHGMDEMTGCISSRSPLLRFLNVLDCPSLNPQRIVDWLQNLPSLLEFGINGERFTENDWRQLGQILPPVTVLYLQNGVCLSPQVWERLYNKMPDLKCLTLENCPEMDDRCLVPFKERGLCVLSLISCPKMTGETLEALSDSSLQSLCLKNCNAIDPKVIANLQTKKKTLVSVCY